MIFIPKVFFFVFLGGYTGVEEVSADSKGRKVVVKGKGVDPRKVWERVQKKSGRKVELISPLPKSQVHQKEEESKNQQQPPPPPSQPTHQKEEVISNNLHYFSNPEELLLFLSLSLSLRQKFKHLACKNSN